MEPSPGATCAAREPERAESDRAAGYSQSVRRFFLALVIVGAMAIVLLVASMAQNHGCLPWQTAVSTGGGPFSENDRGVTVCR